MCQISDGYSTLVQIQEHWPSPSRNESRGFMCVGLTHPKNIEYANSRNQFPDRVTFETGAAQQLRFADASFDASLSLLVFNFIPDPIKALREVRRVTNPGGRVSARFGITEMG